ncbi:MAG: hypothetical protein ACI81R_001532 [Bradymonadia bacterium]|jgi:hypothetical protein
MQRLIVVLCACLCIAADDEATPYPLNAPDNPGGERYGDDDGDDGFDGYPVDPGEPGDSYYDASAEYRAYSPGWTGAFYGGGLLAGYSTLRAGRDRPALRGPAYGALLNWSSLNQIADIQLSYQGARFQRLDLNVRRNSLSAGLLVHPLFLAVLSGNQLAYTISNFYVLVAPTADHVRWEEDLGEHESWSLGWRLGLGIDTYLDSPHDGGAWWLGVQYQFGIFRTPLTDDLLSRTRFREHWLFVRLSYRVNGGLFRGGRGPTVP